MSSSFVSLSLFFIFPTHTYILLQVGWLALLLRIAIIFGWHSSFVLSMYLFGIYPAPYSSCSFVASTVNHVGISPHPSSHHHNSILSSLINHQSSNSQFCKLRITHFPCVLLTLFASPFRQVRYGTVSELDPSIGLLLIPCVSQMTDDDAVDELAFLRFLSNRQSSVRPFQSASTSCSQYSVHIQYTLNLY